MRGRGIDWDAERDLGRLPDAELAVRHNVWPSSVRRARLRRGKPAVGVKANPRSRRVRRYKPTFAQHTVLAVARARKALATGEAATFAAACRLAAGELRMPWQTVHGAHYRMVMRHA